MLYMFRTVSVHLGATLEAVHRIWYMLVRCVAIATQRTSIYRFIHTSVPLVM